MSGDHTNTGLALWKRAIGKIPGGNGLLSKRPDRYAPDLWPCYFNQAKGITVTDLDGKNFLDFAQMGLGCAVLGYANDNIDSKVKAAITCGINTTLNCVEEVLLAEKMIELNPFAGGVKFARTGGEAMSIAVRIARAYTRKDKIAFSGYHGWSDWYLAANLSNCEGLSDHLLPGLEPLGVPKGLAHTMVPVLYNSVGALDQAFMENPDLSIIVMEGARYEFATEEFLNRVGHYQAKGVVVVFDEITSGFRYGPRGVYKNYDFTPDIVVYGKGMGNGYAISAVVGKGDVMATAQDSFISSTFWTERIGFVAALATIEEFQENEVASHLVEVGDKIGRGWEELAKSRGIELSTSSFKPLITFKLNYGDFNTELVTLFIQEMLQRGYLSTTSVYVSQAHTDQAVEKYLDAVNEVFLILKKAIDSESAKPYLKTSLRDEGFKRLT
jgi:glutamate-1-semialdehyde 2,1-aminomutase